MIHAVCTYITSGLIVIHVLGTQITGGVVIHAECVYTIGGLVIHVIGTCL